jgi:hypothetical protein
MSSREMAPTGIMPMSKARPWLPAAAATRRPLTKVSVAWDPKPRRSIWVVRPKFPPPVPVPGVVLPKF